MPTPVDITLLSKPGCHLCDDARAVVVAVCEELRDRGIETELTEHNILDDAQLARLYSEDIPVVLIANRRHSIWQVDAAKLTAAIERTARRPAWLKNRNLNRS